jgi:tyrosyl-tRNA synthetase
LKAAKWVTSTSEAMRLIKQGAVRMDGERIEQIDAAIKKGEQHLFEIGKRRLANIRVN